MNCLQYLLYCSVICTMLLSSCAYKVENKVENKVEKKCDENLFSLYPAEAIEEVDQLLDGKDDYTTICVGAFNKKYLKCLNEATIFNGKKRSPYCESLINAIQSEKASSDESQIDIFCERRKEYKKCINKTSLKQKVFNKEVFTIRPVD